jgi:hypothetical protein
MTDDRMPLAPAAESAAPALPQPGRRRLLTGLLAAPAAAWLGGCASWPGAETWPAPKQVAPISAGDGMGGMPPGWAPYILRRDKRETRYASAFVDGRVVLHALAERSATGANCRVDASAVDTPWLGWSWRVDRLIADANVADHDADDAPARIVVAFAGDSGGLGFRDALFAEQVKLFTGKDLPFATLMYVWDPLLPVGTLVAYPRTSRIRYIVAESGPARLGQWTGYRRNLREDFRLAFGGEAGAIAEVGVLTDSDDLGQTAEAWYGDIALEA